ncbi:MAG: phosphoglucosamine mutase [Candidatus Bathyarchaeota archaeon]|nr:phosphoglucosamine mutase [Candidatus Bathyarchaeota archaeon]
MGKLFGSSGVRGLVNVALTPQLASKIGSAVIAYSKAKKAVVARDTRVSGWMLQEALVSGLTAAGANVSLLGVVPTPALAYLTMALGADVGFMLTASHNPPEYNGIKIFSGDTSSYTEQSQDSVEKIIINNSCTLVDWQSIGKTRNIDVSYAYIELLKKAANLRKPWQVLVDVGCGATFNVAPVALQALGCKVTALNAHPDGYFPARKSEPTPESLTDLARAVKGMGADLGIAFDGDGDRVAFIDEDGVFADFDRVLAAYAAHLLKKHGGGKIVTTVEASMCVETMAERYKGKVVERTKVGDIYVSEAIRRHSAVFGGEPCGAWVHPRFHFCPDGPLSAVLLMQALEEEDKSLREFIAEVPQYVTLRENIICPNELKYKIITNIEKAIVSKFGSGELSTVDGVRLTLKNGWLLIRASGTEPLIRLTAEGESLKVAHDIMSKGIELAKTKVGDVV